MVKGDQIQTQHDLNWGTFDHASHASQLRSCNYYNVCVCVCVCVYDKIQLLWNLVSEGD